MARNLARSGYLTSLWNRTPDKAHTLAAELSIEAATSIQQLASSVDIITSCPFVSINRRIGYRLNSYCFEGNQRLMLVVQ
jgi:glutamyl-tRNA reductase